MVFAFLTQWHVFRSAEASVTLNGVPGASKPITTVSQNGVKEFGYRPSDEKYFDITEYTNMVNSATVSVSSLVQLLIVVLAD